MKTEIAEALTPDERVQWKALRRKMDRTREHFWEFFDAVRTIRDARLYREDFKTFDAFVESEVGLTRQHVNRLITAAETKKRLEPIGSKTPQLEKATESQMRELSKAPPDEQGEVWEEVCENVEQPTAKDIRQAVEKRSKPESKPVIDEAAERARRKIPDLIRSLRLQLDNLGISDRFDRTLEQILEASR